MQQRLEQAWCVAQLERSHQAPLPLPLVASALDGVAQVATRPLNFSAAREENVLSTLECAGSMDTFAQAQDGPPK